MIVLLMQGLYAVVMFMVAVLSLFIVYHILRFSYSKISMIIMLALFIVPVTILFMVNLVLFSNINLGAIFSTF